MKKIASLVSAFLVAGTLATTPMPAKADPYIGEIFIFGGLWCPRGSVEANGQLLPINGNAALFSLFGTTYGGDGNKNFALPNLNKDRTENSPRYCVVVNGVYPER